MLILLLSVCIATVLAECPVTWHHYEDSCYFFSHEKLNWFNAQGSCRAHDARLAEVMSGSQQNFLQYTASLYSSNFWLGGRDDLEEGKWQWSSTKSYFMYTDWAPHEPRGGVSGNCLQMWSASNWQWDDYACSTEIKYICESKIPETVVG
ncbi:hepatic lectin-like [Mytilus edulis]|uniref:hepatic lectin-like n=1 Tax=Mytilus edulis TaxID=6550 RepID=UPI0039EF6871